MGTSKLEVNGTKRRWIVAAIVLLGLALVFVVPYTRTQLLGVIRGEKFYKGRPTNFWIAALNSQDEEELSDALSAIMHAGPEAKAAIPRLLEMMTEQDGRFGRIVASEGDHRLGIQGALMEILKGLGPEAEEHIPAVVKLLESKDPTTRLHVIDLLGALKKHARPAIPELRRSLHDSWPHVRSSARKALEQIEAGAPPEPDY